MIPLSNQSALALAAILVSSCASTRKESVGAAPCYSPLPLNKIGNDLGFQMQDLGMHQYHFYNRRCEFDLLASVNTIQLVDESNDKASDFSPVWTLNGNVSEATLKSKIRAYLYGHKAEQDGGGQPATRPESKYPLDYNP